MSTTKPEPEEPDWDSAPEFGRATLLFLPCTSCTSFAASRL